MATPATINSSSVLGGCFDEVVHEFGTSRPSPGGGGKTDDDDEAQFLMPPSGARINLFAKQAFRAKMQLRYSARQEAYATGTTVLN
jgi:hypothetical protein